MKNRTTPLPTVLILWLIAPAAIYIGLELLHNVALTFLLFHGGVCLALPLADGLLLRKKSWDDHRRSLGLVRFRRAALPALLTGLLFGAAVYGGFSFLQNRLPAAPLIRRALDSWGVDNRYILPLLFVMIFANSVLEEIYWRGYILGKLDALVSPGKAALLSALFYGSYHFITTAGLFGPAFGAAFTAVVCAAGLFWAHMRRRLDSLYGPILSHLLADAGIMLVYLRWFYL